mmetsp:Transcript_27633/g.42523  ORF Transcript_27633/g.42523 Transcript_27633/m.42523 type:complete len:206 (-) Transcript_27633:144-761(-)|eukprot:CAMPEP_0118717172 /NCGR_PEP_ID=MMETSP0800-20121206/27966_1 /TAXON_ID=210618 ORGANISM="Striatella unipunctata, Strain CCMP2910" /NCGR_SAMPLE_ID=MMETSP0800 /ASSEMBLY_ACC=CAM_ASM_000638 /LENGTH=205 /DNA_ID=CAMNT_0006623789 /DNA_START=88 /DNA_END=705 /DNA_ORIENTATION=-
MRGWLALRKAKVEFAEVRLPLDTPEFYEKIGAYSPTNQVPALIDGEAKVWDSLAICEYANERWGKGDLLPTDMAARGKARAIMAEMHTGFKALRSKMPMNCRAKNRKIDIDEALQKDIDRVCSLWQECRQDAKEDGEWLFGKWSIADAMYAPVALRFNSYNVEITPAAQAYVDTVLADPDVADWISAGKEDPEIVEADEAGVEID